jgi:hypothetical protein
MLKGLGGGTDHGIRHVHVIGAGVMGGDIAAWCALQGFSVSLQDREMKYIEPALKRAEELFAKKLKTEDRIAPVRARLVADVDSTKVPEADLVIEAIFENLDAKRALYASLEAAHENLGHPRVEHVEHPADRVAQPTRAAAQVRRPALLQPGGDDAAGRDRPTRWPRPDHRRPHSPRSRRRSTNCRCRSPPRPVFWSTACCSPTCSKPRRSTPKACRARSSIAQPRRSACRWGRSN